MKRSALGVLFLTVIIDLLGFGIVLPLLPRYAHRYDASFGQIGLLMASFSAMQFLFAPVWGRLSDRHGRRRLILIGLGGSVGSYLLFALADSYGLLLASRILAGVFAATIGTAQAYIADSTGHAERGKGMALIGAAFGIGFTIGPVLGWVSYDFLGHRAPGLAAAALSAGAFLLAWFRLPEPDRHRAAAPRGMLDTAALRFAFARPRVLLVLFLQLLATFCFANFEGTLALFTKLKWDLDIRGNGLIFTYVGFCLMVSQGWFVRRYLPRFGERSFALYGSLLLTVGLAGIALAGGLVSILLVLAVAVLGFSMVAPSLSSLLSLLTPGEMQGEVLGLGQSGLALARILGPYAGNQLLAVSPEAPFWIAAGLMLLAGAGTLALRRASPEAG